MLGDASVERGDIFACIPAAAISSSERGQCPPCRADNFVIAHAHPRPPGSSIYDRNVDIMNTELEKHSHQHALVTTPLAS
jgi:hypothetical protein